MAELIVGIINEGLILVNKIVPDQGTRISNLLLNNRRAWDEEIAKGAARDDARLDMLERELLDIGQLFLTAVKSAASKS